jgi:hypothetical protein
MENIVINKIQDLIKTWEAKNKTSFTPSKSFYKDLSIGQKRFWQLAKNEAQPTLNELVTIANHFEVDPKELF